LLFLFPEVEVVKKTLFDMESTAIPKHQPQLSLLFHNHL
jgi:hypothetical protein